MSAVIVLIGIALLVSTLVPRAGATLFDRTLETVLAERPCRVIIESTPQNVTNVAEAAIAAAG